MQEEMKLQDYIRLSLAKIWKNKILIISITLLAFLVGILMASLQSVTNRYYAKATVYTVYSDSVQETSAITSALIGYSDVVTSKKVCERAEAIIGDSSITAQSIQRMITTSYNSSSTIMTISAVSNSPSAAIKVANAVAEAFVMEIQNLTGSDKIQVLDEAENASLMSNGLQGLIKNILTFGIAGFVLSIVAMIASVLFSNKVRSVEQCLDEGEDEILGIIPYIDKKQ